jgi:hypothetical protein
LALGENVEADFNYKLGIRCRQLLFDDTLHMLDVLRGVKTPKYQLGKMRTLINYLKFYEDDAYYIASLKDPVPALVRIFKIVF